MKREKGIYYEKYGDKVYLRNVRTRKDYLFNEIVYDILEEIPLNAHVSEHAVLNALLEQYYVEDKEAFYENMHSFMGLLQSEDIIRDFGDPDNKEQRQSPSDDIQEKCMRERRIFSAGLELTYRCNERCLHCYVDDEESIAGELTLEEYRRILKELRDMGCLNILLTGGEVCMKKDFIQIAEYASSLGMMVDIFTNGLEIGDPKRFDALCSLYPKSISFSLYGGTADVHDGITGVKGSFERTLRAVMMTKCAGIDTYIKTVVMPQNSDSLEELLKWGMRLNVKVTPGFAVLDTHMGRSKDKFRFSSVGEYRHAMEMIRCYSGEKSSAVDKTPHDMVCAVGKSSLCINPYGDVTPCLTIPVRLGNVRESSIRDIWEGSYALKEISEIRFRDLCPGCGECEWFNFCEICMGRTGGFDGKRKEIPEDTCLIARAAGQLLT